MNEQTPTLPIIGNISNASLYWAGMQTEIKTMISLEDNFRLAVTYINDDDSCGIQARLIKTANGTMLYAMTASRDNKTIKTIYLPPDTTSKAFNAGLSLLRRRLQRSSPIPVNSC